MVNTVKQYPMEPSALVLPVLGQENKVVHVAVYRTKRRFAACSDAGRVACLGQRSVGWCWCVSNAVKAVGRWPPV